MAHHLLNPPAKVFRAIFLFVGQGESTLFLVPDGTMHKSMLVDCNRAPKLGGIDLPKLLQNLPTKRDDGSARLDVFVNTHPHNDHVCGVGDIHDATHIEQVWHSGHVPSKDHQGPYQDLLDVIKAVRKRGGTIEELLGTRDVRAFGDAEIHVVAPAQHVCDDLADEEPAARDRRIHEHCTVLRIRYGSGDMRGVLITGDSDKAAWSKHITDYHGKDDDNRIAASVLSASHHGSRTFFKECEDDDDVYTKHLDRIDPSHVVVSAPDQADSPHGHPHDDAMELYRDRVGDDNVLHMTSQRSSFVLDVQEDGSFEIYSDRSELAETYGLEEPTDEEDSGGTPAKKAAPAIYIPRIEQSRPMGSD